MQLRPVLFPLGVLLCFTIFILWLSMGRIIVLFAHKTMTLANENFLRALSFQKSYIYFEYFFFNITNLDEVRKGKKAVVEEIGPFTYRTNIVRLKTVVNGNKTFSFRVCNEHYFDRSRSVLNDDAVIVGFNVPYVAFFQMDSTWYSYFQKKYIHMIMKERLLAAHTVRQWLYEGYPSSLVAMGGKFDPRLARYNGRFGYTVFTNQSITDIESSAEFTMFTGEDDPNLVGRIDRIAGVTQMPKWKPNSSCSEFRYSTEGSIIRLDPDKSFGLYIPDLCRVFRMRPSRDQEVFPFSKPLVRHFLPVVKYELDPNTFKSSLEHEPNQCYTSDLNWAMIEQKAISEFYTKHNETRYIKSGVYDASHCVDAPVLISNPHFLDADPVFADFVDGMKPNKSNSFYSFYFPLLSTTVHVSYAFQINLIVANNPKKTQNGVYPVYWMRVSVDLGDGFLEQLFNLLEAGLRILTLFSVAIFLFGILLIMLSLCSNVRSSKKNVK